MRFCFGQLSQATLGRLLPFFVMVHGGMLSEAGREKASQTDPQAPIEPTLHEISPSDKPPAHHLFWPHRKIIILSWHFVQASKPQPHMLAPTKS
jgi:hypothetical protein